MKKTNRIILIALNVLCTVVLAVAGAMMAGGGAGGGQPFDDCGTIHLHTINDIVVMEFETHNGRSYLLTGAEGFGLEEGMLVCVMGMLDESCSDPGLPGGPIDGCVAVTAIAPDGFNPVELSVGLGTTGMCGSFIVGLDPDKNPCIHFLTSADVEFRVIGPVAPEVLASGGSFVLSQLVVSWPCTSPCGPVSGCINRPLVQSCGIPGDLNFDGVVNGIDLGQMLAVWGTAHALADLNVDQHVNGIDLGILLGNWG